MLDIHEIGTYLFDMNFSFSLKNWLLNLILLELYQKSEHGQKNIWIHANESFALTRFCSMFTVPYSPCNWVLDDIR